MKKAKFNIYSKLKVSPPPFLYSNQHSINSKKNARQQGDAIAKCFSSLKFASHLRCTTPLNKITSSQIDHSALLPCLSQGTKSPVSRKLVFQSESRSKTPSPPLPKAPNVNGSLKAKRELQIVVELKRQIVAHNEVIRRKGKEVEEMKKLISVTRMKEMKAENEVLHCQIEKMKKLIDALNNSEVSQAIEGIDGIECNSAVEIQQKRIIKAMKEENRKMTSTIEKLSQERKEQDLIVAQYQMELNALKKANANSVHHSPRRPNEKEGITLPQLLSPEERSEIEFLLKQCMKAQHISCDKLFQSPKVSNSFELIESILIDSLRIGDKDIWTLRLYLIAISMDDHSTVSLELLHRRLEERLSYRQSEGEDDEIIIDCKANELFLKCKAIDVENRGMISFDQFKLIYSQTYSTPVNNLQSNKAFTSLIRLMKKLDRAPLMQLNYRPLQGKQEDEKRSPSIAQCSMTDEGYFDGYQFPTEKSNAIVNDIFENVLHKQYLNLFKDKEKTEDDANRIVDDIINKVEKDYKAHS